jgi:hypothetical protein
VAGGNITPRVRVSRAINLAHAALAEQGDNFVVTEFVTC